MNKMYRILLLSCLSIFIVIASPAQRIKQELLMAKAGFDTCEIHAYQYSDSQITVQGHRLDLYSSSGLSIGSISFDTLGKIISEYRKQVSPDGLKTTATQINQNGKIDYTVVYQESSDHKRVHYYQINPRGDTLVSQYRIRNHFGFDSVLYTKNERGDYKIMNTWKYDSIGRIVSEERFNNSSKGNYINKKEYHYAEDSDCYLMMNEESFTRICVVNMSDTITFRKPSTGYNYGVTFERQAGGKEIIKYRKDGLIDERIIYSPQGAIINRVKYTYR